MQRVLGAVMRVLPGRPYRSGRRRRRGALRDGGLRVDGPSGFGNCADPMFDSGCAIVSADLAPLAPVVDPPRALFEPMETGAGF